MANPFVHVELHTNDPAKAKAFYTKLFGWKLQDMPMPGGSTYTMIDVGGGTGGGMMTAQPPGSPPRWQAYVGVDDVAASTRKAEELGAKAGRRSRRADVRAGHRRTSEARWRTALWAALIIGMIVPAPSDIRRFDASFARRKPRAFSGQAVP